MSDQSPLEPIPDDTHCEYCGMSYESRKRRDSSSDEPRPPSGSPAPRGAEQDGPQGAEQDGPEIPPLTHCEYCGLEYPEPPASPAPG